MRGVRHREALRRLEGSRPERPSGTPREEHHDNRQTPDPHRRRRHGRHRRRGPHAAQGLLRRGGPRAVEHALLPAAVDPRRRRAGQSAVNRAHRGLGDAEEGDLDQERRLGRRPGQQHHHLRRRGDLRVRRAGGLPGYPTGLEPHRGSRGDAGHGRRLVELPVRPGPAHLGFHPLHAVGHGGVHDAVGADQVRRRAAEDCLPGVRPLAKRGCAQRHRRAPRGADAADLRDPGDRRQPR